MRGAYTYYTVLCDICGHPIRRTVEDLSSDHGCWHHRDVALCRTNIRDDTRNEVRETVLERREQFMRVTHTPPEHPMTRIYDEFLALLEGKPDDPRD
jgi:hypothetical protein